MLTSLTPAALVFLFSFPGFGLHHAAKPTAADSLPPPWRSASRLALEDQFVRTTLPSLIPRFSGLKVNPDPRQLDVRFSLDPGEIATSAQVNDVDVSAPGRETLGDFSKEITQRNFRKAWRDQNKSRINQLGAATQTASSGGLSFKLPSPLPSRVQSLLGPGGPALNVSGSESISLSGQSDWSNQQTGLLGQRRSLFPSLDMQQNLDIRLEGQLSDRIKVNLLQNSANTVPLANRIAINYKGDEDDLIQEFDLGNTNLTLPGTQYVSYSGKNEGLFGIKAAGRLGPLDMTVLASKQEGRSERASYSGGSSRQNNVLLDGDYVQSTYFFLYDPNKSNSIDIPDSSIRVYRDYNTYNADLNTIPGRAFVDPALPDTNSVRGSFKLLQPGADKDYQVIQPYGPLYKVIQLRDPLRPEQVLAVSYSASAVDAQGNDVGGLVTTSGKDTLDADGTSTRRVLRLIKPREQDLDKIQQGYFFTYLDSYDPASKFNATRELELKNVYSLGGQRIDPKTFQLTISKGSLDPPQTTINHATGQPVPYIEALGLDNFDESSGSPKPGHDGKVDGSAPDSRFRTFVDYETGTLFFFDPHPFAPRLFGPGARPFDQFLAGLLSRRDTLVGAVDTVQNAANAKIYERYARQPNQEFLYKIGVDFTAAGVGNDIQLGRGQILEGSDVVTINGQALTRDRDYTIDYDLGRIKLNRGVGPADQLNIDYSYAPLFQQAGRTLVASAFQLQGREKSLGGAFLYESHGAQDIRPRLGEEPSRSLIADLNGDWAAHPLWITRFVDRLPGVRTTAPSDFHVQAEFGTSIPNPNTQNEVFIDDMEGVRDAISLSMGPERWNHSSVPSRFVGAATKFFSGSGPDTLANQHNAEIHWYSPPTVIKEKFLKPTLKQAEGADNARQVLALSIPRRPLKAKNDFVTGEFDTLWAGLTYPLDPVGLDVSRFQFIELWVNDFNDEHISGFPEPRVRGRHVKLHIDLGRVSEDQMRAPDVLPNGVLDSEDLPPRDGQLTATDQNSEDTGLDNLFSFNNRKGVTGTEDAALQRDLTTSGPDDPEGDDFHGPDQNLTNEIDPRRYRFTNGPEDNRQINPLPDTEDLNLNGNLETREDYFEYTIDLGDAASPYLQTDVQRDYPGNTNVTSDNGWRRYRIPLTDSLRIAFGLPDLTLAQHVRVWLEGVINPDPQPDSVRLVTNAQDENHALVKPILMLGSLEIVGSRWQAQNLPDSVQAAGTTVTLNSVNTLDNADVYVPPFDPGETRNGNQGVTRREQSLALEFTRLNPGQSLEAFKTFSIDEDYTRYGKLDWFATGFGVPGYDPVADSLAYFVRFASDEVGGSYYEYRAPLPQRVGTVDWHEIQLKLTDLANLKQASNFPKVDPILYQVPGANPGELYTVKGRPSFTRVRRISIGVINLHTNAARTFERGQLWFDELRAIDVQKDVGHAQRFLVNGRFANLMSYNMTYNSRDADFLSVGETRGQGSSTSQLNFNSGLDLHRFFEGTGIVLPVGYGYATTSSKPRFTAGDDVVRLGAAADASETRSETQSWSSSYQRTWSDRSNPFLRYTLGGFTGSINRSQTISRNPSTVDTSTSLGGVVNYGIAPRNLMTLALPGTKLKIYPLPERFYWNYQILTTESRTYDRLRDSTGSLVLRNLTKGRTALINFGADTRPFDLLHHHVEGVRNLTLADNLNQSLGFINFGRLVSWRQSFDSHYSFTKGSRWLRPALNWNSGYGQGNGPELSADLSVKSISNSQGATMTWLLPFDALATQAARPAVRAPNDTTPVPRASPFRAKSLLSRLGSLNAEASFGNSSSYSRITGNPNPIYLLGLVSDPGIGEPRIGVQFGNQSTKNSNARGAMRTRLALALGASLGTRGEYIWQRSNTNDDVGRTIQTRFPDLDMDYGRLAHAIGLDRLFKDPRLTTSYNRSRESDYRNSADPYATATSSVLHPLDVDGALKNGTRASLKIERRVTLREDFQFGHSVTTDRNSQVSLGLNRTYTQGQKVNILGKQSVVKTTVNLGLSADYQRRTGETRRDGVARVQAPIGQDRLSVNGTGSYGFSSNVTGNVSLGFGQNRDLQTSIVRRNVRVELRAQFTF
ncbi:MAG TPA: cell surface protein SprA [Candidatus Saccharimonadaceae bacterium]|jgi:hypothetical protein|nr:cell surface protein SprA [Candidatus Saccharimonadaceae bacterium]